MRLVKEPPTPGELRFSCVNIRKSLCYGLVAYDVLDSVMRIPVDPVEKPWPIRHLLYYMYLTIIFACATNKTDQRSRTWQRTSKRNGENWLRNKCPTKWTQKTQRVSHVSLGRHVHRLLTKSRVVATDKSKKRRAEGATAKGAPPAKKAAVPGATTMAPKAVSVKKESKAVVKDAKSDSSFFSKPKPTKKEMPSFKKNVPPPTAPVKKEPDLNIAQPSSFNPFEEVLKSYGSTGASATPPPSVPSATAGPSTPITATAGPSGLTKKGKPRRSVTWAPEGQLEQIRLIERAVYDDDPAIVSHFRSSRRMYCMLIRRLERHCTHRARIRRITSATLTATRERRCTHRRRCSTNRSSGRSHNVSTPCVVSYDLVTNYGRCST